MNNNDALTMDKERNEKTENKLDECYQMISNLYIAIEFDEKIVAKNLYKELLEKYELMDPDQKKEIYTSLVRVYNLLNYILEY